MIYLATGNDVQAARKALGVNQAALAVYWGFTRDVISRWERAGADLVPQPRVAAVLLASLRRGWFPAGGQGIKKRRRQPAAVVAGQAIRDARELFDLRIEDLAAYWGMSRANVGAMEVRAALPNPAMWDILLDDLMRQKRTDVLRWGMRRPPAVVPKKPRGRYAGKALGAMQNKAASADDTP